MRPDRPRTKMELRLRTASTVVTSALVIACGGTTLSTGQGSAQGDSDASAANDATTTTFDGGPEASTDAPEQQAVYHDIAVPSFWSEFGFSTMAFPNVQSFAGGTFDGRYLYVAPSGNGVAARYDTQASFTANTSWSVFDTASVNAQVTSFWGAVFDGRYVYLSPGASSGIAARFDTRGSFTDLSAWSTFDISSVNPNARGFGGAVFDGHFIYFAAHFDLSGPNSSGTGVYARYDTQAPFLAASSWTTSAVMDATALGGVFDGRYVHFVFYGGDLRYDTQSSFTTPGSWSLFSPPVNGHGYTAGGAFDGRYVYLAAGYWYSPTEQYDTLAAFDASSSWTNFDEGVQASADCAGGAFDGRYVYFGGAAPARYDTQGKFYADSSWQKFSLNGCHPGMVFDGRYMYFIGATVQRFDSRTPPSLPKLPAFSGSFF